MLERMRRKGNPSTLLRILAVEATVENSMDIPQKTINGIAL